MATAKDGRITKQMLKTRSGEFDIESIHSLILKGQDISDLGCLGECAGLERLDLSQNEVNRLHGLAGLTNLMYLNLSDNNISSLEGLQALDNLTILNVAGNQIANTDALRCLTGLDKLTELRLYDRVHELSNPVCLQADYKTQVVAMFPKLLVLDGERLSGKGSELYALCTEIDLALAAVSSSENEELQELPVPGPWLSQGFWDSKDTRFENSDLYDAEQQLQDMLAQCKGVCAEADRKLLTQQSQSTAT